MLYIRERFEFVVWGWSWGLRRSAKVIEEVEHEGNVNQRVLVGH
jgi:hypothetical protein